MMINRRNGFQLIKDIPVNYIRKTDHKNIINESDEDSCNMGLDMFKGGMYKNPVFIHLIYVRKQITHLFKSVNNFSSKKIRLQN